MATTKKNPVKVAFVNRFTDYFRRAKFDGQKTWTADPKFVVRRGEDLWPIAKQHIRATEVENFFLWLESEYTTFIDAHEFPQVCQRWDDGRHTRETAAPPELSSEFRATLETYGFAADILSDTEPGRHFARVRAYTYCVLGVWRWTKIYLDLPDDSARAKVYFQQVGVILGTADRMQQLEDRVQRDHDEATKMAGLSLAEKWKILKRVQTAAAKPMPKPVQYKVPKEQGPKEPRRKWDPAAIMETEGGA